MGAHKKILTEEERKVYLDKFYQIMNTFDDSNLSIDEKVYSFLKIYSTVRKFEVDYEYFLDKCGEYEGCNIDQLCLRSLYETILELDKKNYISNLQYVIKMEDKINYYDYAQYIINAYLTSKNSYLLESFYQLMNINESIFNYCVKIIKELDVSLYHQYEEKKLENIQKRFDDRVESLREISTGIKTGFLSDGTPFDILQFWKLVPFKYFHGLQMELHEYHNYITPRVKLTPDPTLYLRVRNFITPTLWDEKDVVLGYMRDNNIKHFKYTSLNKILGYYDDITSKKKLLPNGEVTEIDIDAEKEMAIQIFKYIEYHQLPSLLEVYRVLKERYLNGDDLSVPTVENKMKPLILDEKMEFQKEKIKNLSAVKPHIRRN